MFTEELFSVFEDESGKAVKIKRPSSGKETVAPKKKKLDLDTLEGEKDDEAERGEPSS